MNALIDYRAYAVRYGQAHAAITAETVEAFLALCTDDIVFHDPFNDTVGKPPLRHIYHDMLKSARNLKIEVLDVVGDDRRWILKWRMLAALPVIGAIDVTGMTELRLADDGRVASHIDYWDSGPEIYAKVPILGGLVQALRRKLSATSRS